VGHEHGGEPELALQLADLDAHVVAQLRIEVGERLVEEEHLGLHHEGAGQGHALLLAAGELARIALAVAFQPHEPQRLLDAGRGLGLRDLSHLEPEGHVLGHRHVREERVTLEHHAGVAPVRRHMGDVLGPDGDAPEVTGMKPAIMRKVVVLPQPEGPRRATNSPCSTVNEKSRTAATLP
jgi:hypothetical protein